MMEHIQNKCGRLHLPIQLLYIEKNSFPYVEMRQRHMLNDYAALVGLICQHLYICLHTAVLFSRGCLLHIWLNLICNRAVVVLDAVPNPHQLLLWTSHQKD